MSETELKNIIEALLFVSEKPLSMNDLKKVVEDIEPAEIKCALGELQNKYKAPESSVILSEIAGGYRFETGPTYAPWIKKLFNKKALKMSAPSLETLAVIAYKQPVTKAEVEIIRGVNADGVIKNLLERELIKISGRKDVPGRPLLYGTTNAFLEQFGLKSLKELPHPRDFKESEILFQNQEHDLFTLAEEGVSKEGETLVEEEKNSEAPANEAENLDIEKQDINLSEASDAQKT